MNKSTVLKFINPALALLLINQVLSGPLYAATNSEFLEGLHTAGGVTLAAVSALHLWLNWGWVRATLLKKPTH